MDSSRTRTSRTHWGVWLFILFSVAGYGGMVWIDQTSGTLRGASTPYTIGAYLVAYAAFLGSIIWAERHFVSRKTIWITAVILRLILLFTTPTLSDDVYRYIWDGHVAQNSVSPYAYAVDSPILNYLQIPERELVNNAWMASPYLPAAQALFWGITAVSPLSPFGMQLIMIIIDLLVAWVLSKLLALANLPTHRLILYLWNPLVIVEVAHSAHIDAWMILLTLLAIYFAIHNSQFTIFNSQFLSPFFLALATLTKIIPVLLLPVLFWQWNWRQRFFYGITTIGILLPFGISAGWGLGESLDGRGLFGALRIYNAEWNFNSGLFHWIERQLNVPGFGTPSPKAKLIVVGLMLVVILTVWLLARKRPFPHKRHTPRQLLRFMFVPFGAYVLLSPTMHPWYMLILLAFLPFLPPAKDEAKWGWLWAAPWLYLAGALIFSYLTYLNPASFGEILWVRQVEWIPTIGLLLLATAVNIWWQQRTAGRNR